ncbi:urease accessory protein UreD [uncultured Jatrophihabitans sp.]|uniref:urease accessory protein UreD n=1 Tax=uncultured Jatrophihabitans sp. TaxID=1610747 RepID=UPI0035CC2993
MRASTSAVVRAGGVLGDLRCEPPLTVRRVTAPPGVCGLCLVGTAAGPLAGDEHLLDLRLEPYARAALTAAGASIAQGRGGAPATVTQRARLDAGAELVADPGPLVVSEGSRVAVRVELDLAADASIEWRELIVLGRSMDAAPGRATVRWDVVRAGRPVLRQLLRLPTMFAPRRVLASALLTGPLVAARTVVAGPLAVAQQIDATTSLVTVLADDAASAVRERDRLVRLVSGQRSALAGVRAPLGEHDGLEDHRDRVQQD